MTGFLFNNVRQNTTWHQPLIIKIISLSGSKNSINEVNTIRLLEFSKAAVHWGVQWNVALALNKLYNGLSSVERKACLYFGTKALTMASTFPLDGLMPSLDRK